MQVTADSPQEILGLGKAFVFALGEIAAIDHLVGAGSAADVFRDPEQRLQVAQPALAFLDIGLLHIALAALPQVSFFALRQFHFDEFSLGSLDHVLPELDLEVFRQFLVTAYVTAFQHGGPDRLVGFCQPDTIGNRAGGMPDLQAHVPKDIEHALYDALGPGRQLVG